MRILVTGTDCPVLPGVTVGVQHRDDVEQERPADGSVVTWDLDATVHRTDARGLDLRGPYVHGRPGDRFLYLVWQRDGVRFGRTKLMLGALPDGLLDRAEHAGLAGRLPLALPDGRPVLAAVRPPRIEWSVLT